MDSPMIAGIAFACTFGGALFGIWLRRVLPESHLNEDAKYVVTLGTGLLATVTGLVLGLMIDSAKSSFDAQRNGFQQLSTNLIVLERALQFYGPETQVVREHLRRTVELLLEHRWPAGGPRSNGLDSPEITESAAKLFAAICDLAPKTEAQKACQSQALSVSVDLAKTRWQLSQDDSGSIPTPFLVVLIFWLTVLFITFGLFAPRNATVHAILFICALSLAAALFLIVELDRPFNGMIQISSKPLRDALGQMRP